MNCTPLESVPAMSNPTTRMLLIERAEAAGLQQLRLDSPLWRIRLGICFRTPAAEFAPLQALIRMALEPVP